MTLARRRQLGLALAYHGLGGEFLALAQADLAGCGDFAVLGLTQLGAGPVSYTHLDVYKRQDRCRRAVSQPHRRHRGATGG